MPIGIVTNPRSKKNLRNPGNIRRLMDLEAEDVLVRATSDLSELPDVIDEFLDAGCEAWIADGGDGTLHWLLNVAGDKLKKEGRWDGVSPFPIPLSPANGGTAGFVAKKLGIKGPSDLFAQSLIDDMRAGKTLKTQPVKTLHFSGTKVDGGEFDQLGFAAALGGIGERFFEQYYAEPNPNKWTIIYVTMRAALGHLASFVPVGGIGWLDRLKDYGRRMLEGTNAIVTVDDQQFHYDTFQGLYAGAIDVDLGTIALFSYASDPDKMHYVAGALDRIECTWKWFFLVLGRPIPGGTWHELPGINMSVIPQGGQTVTPVIDGEFADTLTTIHVKPGPLVYAAMPSSK